MSLISYPINSGVQLEGDGKAQLSDVIGLMAACYVAQGFTITNDIAVGVGGFREIWLKCPNECPYSIYLTAWTQGSNAWGLRFRIMGADGVTSIGSWDGNTSGGNASCYMQGGAIQVLKGDNTLFFLWVPTRGGEPTMAFGLLKFNDGLWYLWAPVAGGNNGSILNGVDNTLRSTQFGIYYPPSVAGTYPVIPWAVQEVGSNNVWAVFPLSAFSINPTLFTNGLFYHNGEGNMYHYGTIMISD
jgi:hypothetical protein